MGQYEDFECRSRHLRTVAFTAVSFSTVAVAACLMAFPAAFHYVQELQSQVEINLDFCKAQTRDLWKEMLDAEHKKDAGGVRISHGISMLKAMDPNAETAQYIRPKRQASTMICCTCHRGPAGQPGAEGSHGRDGVPGDRGNPGKNGRPGEAIDLTDVFAPQCPCESDPGPSGAPGPVGDPGRPGNEGMNGRSGPMGSPGQLGPKGTPGRPGQSGMKGMRGNSGGFGVEAGPPGEQGPPGLPGFVGRPGDAGKPGQDGRSGEKGIGGEPGFDGRDARNGSPGGPGRMGDDGPKGSCDHCPAARLAPGY